MLDRVFLKIHQEGYKFIIIAALITVVLYLISNFLGLVGLVLTIWVYYFFRDPERVSINDENYLVSPADGLVVDVLKTNGPKELGLENRNFKKISIFMNAFDCHVNRSPCSGKVSDIIYVPGKFLNASLDKASEDNERNYYNIKNKQGEDIIVVQIAGLIARRIVCNVNKNQDLKKGERIGIIKFGSRVDLYLPKSNKVLVSKGQKVIGGETIISNPKNIREITATVTK